MALVLADRVKETTTTTGTGALTLAGATTGYQSFSAIGDGNTCYYAISSVGSTEWEVGIGTYTASGTTLARTTILASSNSGSVVTLSSGIKEVYVVYPASKAVYEDAAGKVDVPSLAINGSDVTSTATELNLLDGVTATTAELNLLDGITATTTELNYTDGVTSNIQTQIDAANANSLAFAIALG